jgi:hypothetical protein
LWWLLPVVVALQIVALCEAMPKVVELHFGQSAFGVIPEGGEACEFPRELLRLHLGRRCRLRLTGERGGLKLKLPEDIGQLCNQYCRPGLKAAAAAAKPVNAPGPKAKAAAPTASAGSSGSGSTGVLATGSAKAESGLPTAGTTARGASRAPYQAGEQLSLMNMGLCGPVPASLALATGLRQLLLAQNPELRRELRVLDPGGEEIPLDADGEIHCETQEQTQAFLAALARVRVEASEQRVGDAA